MALIAKLFVKRCVQLICQSCDRRRHRFCTYLLKQGFCRNYQCAIQRRVNIIIMLHFGKLAFFIS